MGLFHTVSEKDGYFSRK